MRMLGHMGLFGCGSSKCPHCSEDGTTRRRKRAERRDVMRELELDLQGALDEREASPHMPRHPWPADPEG